MNNEIFGRLLGLLEKLGMSVESGTFTRAEAAAYARAVSLAHDEMENTIKNLFIDSAETQGLALFLSLIGRRPAESEEASKNLVIEAVSEDFGLGSLSEFEDAVGRLGDGADYEVDGDTIIIKPGDTEDPDFAERLGDFIKDYVPGFSHIEIEGDGSDFEARDAAGRRWFELDGYNLPFSVIDSL